MTATFNLTRNDIINQSSEVIGMYSPDLALSGEDTAIAAMKLNMLVKYLQKDGIHLWSQAEASLFLVDGQASYSLSTSGAHCTTNYAETTLSANAASGAVSISLASATGISIGQYIGILLNTNNLHWTTISNLVGTTATLASGLSSAADAAQTVYAFTAKIARPLRLIEDTCYLRNSDSQDTPISTMSRSDYAMLANKTSESRPVQIYYDPQLSAGVLKLWPVPDSSLNILRFSYQRPIEDFNLSTDNPDFPIEWGLPLVYSLAVLRAPGTGISAAEFSIIKSQADEYMAGALGFDRENTSIFVQPDIR